MRGSAPVWKAAAVALKACVVDVPSQRNPFVLIVTVVTGVAPKAKVLASACTCSESSVTPVWIVPVAA